MDAERLSIEIAELRLKRRRIEEQRRKTQNRLEDLNRQREKLEEEDRAKERALQGIDANLQILVRQRNVLNRQNNR